LFNLSAGKAMQWFPACAELEDRHDFGVGGGIGLHLAPLTAIEQPGFHG
jgi:hypothetical protein